MSTPKPTTSPSSMDTKNTPSFYSSFEPSSTPTSTPTAATLLPSNPATELASPTPTSTNKFTTTELHTSSPGPTSVEENELVTGRCPMDTLIWSDEIDVATSDFANTRAIEFMHERSPRFGNSNQLAAGISDGNEDYVQGLIASSIATGIFFLVWACFIIRLNRNGTPLLNGEPLKINPPPQAPSYPQYNPAQKPDSEEEEVETSEEQDKLPPSNDTEPRAFSRFRDRYTKTKQQRRRENKPDWNKFVVAGNVFWKKKEPMPRDPERDTHLTEKQIKKYVHRHRKYKHEFDEWQFQTQQERRRLKMMRVLVVIACCITIASSLIITIKGSEHLLQAIDSGKDDLSQAIDTTQKGIDLVDQFLFNRAQTDSGRQILMSELNEFCPKVTDTICNDILAARDCQYDDLPYRIPLQSVIDYVAILQEVLATEILDFRFDLYDFILSINSWQNALDDFHWALYVAIAVCLILAIFCFYIMVGVLLAWRERLPRTFSCLRHPVIIPLYILLVILAWVFSCVFMIGSMAVADFCVDSPDRKLEDLMYRYDGQLSTSALGFGTYILSGCANRYIPTDFTNKIELTYATMEKLRDLRRALQYTGENLIGVCGKDPQPTLVSIELVEHDLCKIATFLGDVRSFFGCETWFPVYQRAAHDTVCYTAADGFAWLAISQFIIVFSCILILTLRSAFYQVEVVPGQTHAIGLERQIVNVGTTPVDDAEQSEPLAQQASSIQRKDDVETPSISQDGSEIQSGLVPIPVNLKESETNSSFTTEGGADLEQQGGIENTTSASPCSPSENYALTTIAEESASSLSVNQDIKPGQSVFDESLETSMKAIPSNSEKAVSADKIFDDNEVSGEDGNKSYENTLKEKSKDVEVGNEGVKMKAIVIDGSEDSDGEDDVNEKSSQGSKLRGKPLSTSDAENDNGANDLRTFAESEEPVESPIKASQPGTTQQEDPRPRELNEESMELLSSSRKDQNAEPKEEVSGVAEESEALNGSADFQSEGAGTFGEGKGTVTTTGKLEDAAVTNAAQLDRNDETALDSEVPEAIETEEESDESENMSHRGESTLRSREPDSPPLEPESYLMRGVISPVWTQSKMHQEEGEVLKQTLLEDSSGIFEDKSDDESDGEGRYFCNQTDAQGELGLNAATQDSLQNQTEELLSTSANSKPLPTKPKDLSEFDRSESDHVNPTLPLKGGNNRQVESASGLITSLERNPDDTGEDKLPRSEKVGVLMRKLSSSENKGDAASNDSTEVEVVTISKPSTSNDASSDSDALELFERVYLKEGNRELEREISNGSPQVLPMFQRLSMTENSNSKLQIYADEGEREPTAESAKSDESQSEIEKEVNKTSPMDYSLQTDVGGVGEATKDKVEESVVVAKIETLDKEGKVLEEVGHGDGSATKCEDEVLVPFQRPSLSSQDPSIEVLRGPSSGSHDSTVDNSADLNSDDGNFVNPLLNEEDMKNDDGHFSLNIDVAGSGASLGEESTLGDSTLSGLQEKSTTHPSSASTRDKRNPSSPNTTDN